MLKSVQYLRALAAVLVALFHCFYSAVFTAGERQPFMWMASGVDIFFVISGFVMVLSTERKSTTPTRFLIDRVIRIVPLYWVASLLMLASVPVGGMEYILGSFFFVPVLHPTSGHYEPLLQQGWTLNYEMFFYVLFAFTLMLKSSYRLWVCGALFCAVLIAVHGFGATGALGFYGHPVIVEFLMGMAIAKFRPKLHWAFIPLGFALLALSDQWVFNRAIEYGVPAAVIVAAAVAAEMRLPHSDILVRIGDASYALYLFHFFALAMVVPLWLTSPLSAWLFPPAALAVVVVLSLIVHTTLERPMHHFLKQRFDHRTYEPAEQR